jgi:signal transduction histidine kinase
MNAAGAVIVAGAEPEESEEAITTRELLQFVYTCPQGIAMVSHGGTARLLSAGAAALLSSLSDDGGIDDVFALLETCAPRFRELLRDGVAGPSASLDGLRIHVPARSRRPESWLEVSGKGLHGGGYSLALRDVTSLVESETRYRAAIAAEAHARGKAETACGILHDLGNTLTGIGGRAVELRGCLGDSSVTRNLARAQAFLEPNAAALDAVVGGEGRGRALVDLLGSLATAADKTRQSALESLEKLGESLSFAQEVLSIQRTYAVAGSDASQGYVSVERVFIDVVSMETSFVQKRSATIRIEPGAAFSALRVDRTKLMQVLLNLVRNAAEAFEDLPEGRSPEIVLSVSREPGVGLAIDVRDTGPGFGAEIAVRLFERDFSTKERGSGVGLASCRAIVESFGATLKLKSDGPGTGALARIAFPMELVADDR